MDVNWLEDQVSPSGIGSQGNTRTRENGGHSLLLGRVSVPMCTYGIEKYNFFRVCNFFLFNGTKGENGGFAFGESQYKPKNSF